MAKENKIIIFVAVICIIVGICVFSRLSGKKEGYSNYQLKEAGDYPRQVNEPILDSFKHTGHKYASNDSSSGIWWYYPIFEVGSYEQITNNLRYRNNPDEGTCSRADMCGALYRRKKNKSNIARPLPEAEEGPGARVNYYRTMPNELAFSIPTNENIIY